jgi:threonine dehydrogenase-like Zn-dependent dehydrogenase
VHEVVPSVHTRRVGDRVMVLFDIFCGTCYFCARGLHSKCHNEKNPETTAVGGIHGYSHTCDGHDGGQAEFVRASSRTSAGGADRFHHVLDLVVVATVDVRERPDGTPCEGSPST